jgi:hypothetical protein
LILIQIHGLIIIAARECRTMSDQPSVSAQIGPFRTRRPKVPGSTDRKPTDGGQERLRRALVALDTAIAGQRDAVAAWRSTLANLGAVMGGLGESVQRYRGSLDALDNRVAKLHAQAAQLERTADAALAVGPD